MVEMGKIREIATKIGIKTPTLKALTQLSAPRVGFDVIRGSAATAYGPSAPSLPHLFPPKVIGPFPRVADQALSTHSSPLYRRRATYTDPAHSMTIALLYNPRTFPRPLFQIQWEASVHKLLDLAQVEAVLNECPWAHEVKVSGVEVALDIPGPLASLKMLQHAFDPPWVRERNAPRRRQQTHYRLYDKRREGIDANRVEWVVPRRELRRHGAVTIADLRRINWDVLLRRRLRFRLVKPRKAKQRPAREWVLYSVKAVGVGRVRRTWKKARRWLRDQCHVHPLHSAIDVAVVEFSTAVARGATG